MGRPTVVLDLAGDHALARDLVAGGVFVPGCTVGLNQDCELVVRSGSEEVRVSAMVVWVDGVRGVGLQLVDCTAELKHRIAALAAGDPAAPRSFTEPSGERTEPSGERTEPSGERTEPSGERTEPSGERTESSDEAEAARRIALNVNERLRNLTLAQQVRLAQKGEVSERIVLERMYGKNVWEGLLRNPRLTGPEVARIARMGGLARPLMEIIVGNGGWLQIPEVRRALLSNPRLSTDQIMRVLRLLPKHELKVAALQTAYSFAVRDAARRMLRESE